MQRVLVRALGELSDPYRGNILHERAYAGHPQQCRAQLLDDGIGRRAFFARLQRHEDTAVVERLGRSAGADERHDVLDVAVLAYDLRDLPLEARHRVEGDILGGLGDDEYLSNVVTRQKALRHVPEQRRCPGDDGTEDDHRQATALHHPCEAGSVGIEQRVEHAFGERVEPSMPLLALHLEHAAAKHGRERQRHDTRDEHRDNDGDGKFLEQPAKDAAHEQDRNEDGGKRYRHRDDREADLFGAVQRRLQS